MPINEGKKLKVLMVAAEASPFAKVGGLGDVVGSLPVALEKIGVETRVVLPLYGCINKKKYGLKKIYSNFEIPSDKHLVKVNVWETMLPGSSVKVYFIDAPKYFSEKDIYIHGDNSERFLFFSLATLYTLPIMEFRPDIIHIHDSHPALIPDIIKTSRINHLKDIKTLFTIHNFRYQGKADPIVLSTGNLRKDSLKSLTVDASDGDINFMVQGLLNSDLINTVSKTYAEEITTSFYGAGLERLLRKRKEDLSGILNGIDTEMFNPESDERIKANYSVSDVEKKVKNKIFLQKKLGLPVKADVALCGMVTRLAWQKGIELFTEHFAKLGCQFVFLGTGDLKYENKLKDLAKKYPDTISVNTTFSVELAQQIYAGSDIFLMPSRYEPCGLGQIIAMRYGTIPVARATGGLKDTVTPDVGFTFEKISRDDFYATIKKALNVYYKEPLVWRGMMVAAMKKDFSWDKSAGEYVELYRQLTINN
jgi:starch synthase